jgi:hypothetical protein
MKLLRTRSRFWASRGVPWVPLQYSEQANENVPWFWQLQRCSTIVRIPKQDPVPTNQPTGAWDDVLCMLVPGVGSLVSFQSAGASTSPLACVCSGAVVQCGCSVLRAYLSV